jgi:hypothetical protein
VGDEWLTITKAVRGASFRGFGFWLLASGFWLLASGFWLLAHVQVQVQAHARVGSWELGAGSEGGKVPKVEWYGWYGM